MNLNNHYSILYNTLMIIYTFEIIKNKLSLNNFSLKLNTCEAIQVYVSHSLLHFISKAKKCIDYNVHEWDIYKKIINPYEFIHTPPFQNGYNQQSIANYNAISRSFYKLIEIINFFDLLDVYKDKPIQSFHLAEGPGGFIEAMIYLRRGYYANDNYYGMTLQSSNKNIPKWKKLLEKFRFITSIHIEHGIKNNGDILDPDNYLHCSKLYKNSMDFITGDGGFDFSLDYDKQELHSLKLVFAQVMYALTLQKEGGTFVLKIFDIFYKPSIEILYILNSFYETVSVCKPKTSRFANSEKYIVCKGFLYKNTEMLISVFLKNLVDFENNNTMIESILNIDIPLLFSKEIEELNVIFGKKQLSTIHTTLMMIQEKRVDKIEKLRKNNIEKSMKWCEINNFPYNPIFKPKNVFTKRSNPRNYNFNIHRPIYNNKSQLFGLYHQ